MDNQRTRRDFQSGMHADTDKNNLDPSASSASKVKRSCSAKSPDGQCLADNFKRQKVDPRMELQFPQLIALNDCYLKLLIDLQPSAETPSRELPEWLVLLSTLSTKERNAIAACPYALFDFGFDADSEWLATICDNPPNSATSRFSLHGGWHAHSQQSGVQSFVSAAYFYIWHSTQIDMTFARFAFGLGDELANALRSAPVLSVATHLQFAIDRLKPRWCADPHFWPDLLRFVDGATIPFQLSRLSGCQLTAATLLNTAAKGRIRQPSLTRK